MDKQKCKVLIMGAGNLLMSDDGLGVYTVERLKQEKWPPGVVIVEAGTAVQNFFCEMSRSDTVIVVDAVQAGGKPGDIYRLEEKNIAHLPIESRFDAHGFSILQHIEMIRELTGLPKKVIIYGVEPSDLSFGIRLSPSVEKAVPELVNQITKEIKNLIIA